MRVAIEKVLHIVGPPFVRLSGDHQGVPARGFAAARLTLPLLSVVFAVRIDFCVIMDRSWKPSVGLPVVLVPPMASWADGPNTSQRPGALTSILMDTSRRRGMGHQPTGPRSPECFVGWPAVAWVLVAFHTLFAPILI